MKHLVLAVPAIAFAPLLAAADWTAVAPGTANTLMFDRDSVVMRGDLAQVLSQAEFHPAATVSVAPRSVARVVSLLEFDCVAGTERAVWTRFYGQGDLVGHPVIVRSAPRSAPPASIGERLMRRVCGGAGL